MANARRLTAKELAKATKTVRCLLSDCFAVTKSFPPSNNDYAEAHGYVRALEDANFLEAKDKALLTTLKEEVRNGNTCGHQHGK